MDRDTANAEFLQNSFIREIEENLIQIETLVKESHDTFSMEEIETLFRKIHSMKGLAVMMDDTTVAEVIHTVEETVFYLREKRTLKAEELQIIMNFIISGIDFIKKQIAVVKERHLLKTETDYQLINSISDFLDNSLKIREALHVKKDIKYRKNKANDKITFSGLFPKASKMVEIMNHEFHKNAVLEFKGMDIETTKPVFEKVSTAVLQMVKNSLDHGIEDTLTRKTLGKPLEGKVGIEIKKTSEGIIVAVSDDGRGIEKKKVLSVAKRRNLLVKPEEEYTDREIYRLILKAGFTTKHKATLFSGRGVGLDTVNSNITSMGGFIVIDSEEKKGCRFIMALPIEKNCTTY